MIYFKFPENEVGEEIEFFDIYGKMIYSSGINANKLNIENMPAGLYIIRIKSLRNESYYSKVLKIR